MEDIRDKPHIDHKDVTGLNFIRKQKAFVFRKYFKQGLRSQIIEVLDSSDVLKQNRGEFIDGIRFFPWAKPLKILRIFRAKFESLESVFGEIKKYKILEKYLPPDSYSKSCEFIVEYIREGQRDLILCGLQEFVDGLVLNPWELVQKNHLAKLVRNLRDQSPNSLEMTNDQFIHKVQEKSGKFIEGLKLMIIEANYLPDLAGVGNLILTSSGNIKLVDINNISEVSFGQDIKIDDKGYPVCDKSIEAISIMEQNLLERTIDRTEKLYKIFLDPQRMKNVKDLEDKFHQSIKLKQHYPT